MHWILQNNIFNELDWEVLIDTLVRFDIPYTEVKIVPFVGEIVPEPVIDSKTVICVGSYSMRHAARKYGWNPGVFDLEPFDFTHQLEHWGKHMLNYGAVISTFEDAVFTEEEMFIRPIHDSKVFPGKVMDREEFVEWQAQVCKLQLDFGNSLQNCTPIQLCTPRKIFSEHRFWVVRGKVVTSSTYKIGRTVHYQAVSDDRFQEFAEERIAEWQPHDAFVIDVADTSEGLKIVEINTLNACGFYAANIQKLVMSLEENFN